MSNQTKMNAATKAINILKENGYQAYIVGGAVRDYLLKRETNDIDITTNAKPFEVSRVFSSSKPTGIKYGTVTIYLLDEQIEVTTFRTDGEYLDNRHPSQVIYGDNAYDDVLRRDFTINGLLMDENLKVVDFVDGRADLEKKVIRAIGDPRKRFKEDALRILRAVYFQSKLGFQIEKETRIAMEEQKEDILNISKERVLMELIKTIKGKYFKRALKTLDTTGISKVLPGLEKGVSFFIEAKELPYVDVFFTACFALNGGVPSYYPFSNKHRHMYQTASNLANMHLSFDNNVLFTYGVEMCILANKANFFLGRSKLLTKYIIEDYDKLPLKSDLDLKLRAQEILSLTNKKAGAWLKELQNDLVKMVLDKKIKNTKEELINVLKERGFI
ncbi:CCA tRNA nucleotidyltransferase [Acholeplasma sp. OttesenSCG-928-E16]|nr:CCA tRNA nucleotidyltransferase [Acholeplasma sp. OttesenSCG-928-E16]